MKNIENISLHLQQVRAKQFLKKKASKPVEIIITETHIKLRSTSIRSIINKLTLDFPVQKELLNKVLTHTEKYYWQRQNKYMAKIFQKLAKHGLVITYLNEAGKDAEFVLSFKI